MYIYWVNWAPLNYPIGLLRRIPAADNSLAGDTSEAFFIAVANKEEIRGDVSEPEASGRIVTGLLQKGGTRHIATDVGTIEWIRKKRVQAAAYNPSQGAETEKHETKGIKDADYTKDETQCGKDTAQRGTRSATMCLHCIFQVIHAAMHG